MLKPKITAVYDWNDIEKELCSLMSIAENHFRDYGLVVGGKGYKDLWHVALDTIIPPHMDNDTTVTMFEFDIDYFDDPEYSGENAWKQPMIKAWNTLYSSIVSDNSGIEVHFSW